MIMVPITLLFAVLLISPVLYYLISILLYLKDVMFQENLSTSHINEPNPDSVNKEGTAVVIGGSIGGLLAATTLSQHFKQVIICEQGEYQDDKSVAPQGEQIHILLFRGRDILAKMFPGFWDEMVQNGGRMLDASEIDMFVGQHGRRPPVEKGELDELGLFPSQSRRLLELTIRERVRKIQNIEFRDDCRVIGFLSTGKTITGVRVNEDGTEKEIQANLTVDCSGSGSKSLQWLTKLVDPKCTDITKKYKTQHKLNIVYSCMEFYHTNPDGKLHIRERLNGQPIRISIYLPKLPTIKGMLVYEIEDGRAMLMFGGSGKDAGLKTLQDAVDFMSTEPEFAQETLKIIQSQMEDDQQQFKIYKKSGSSFNHYDRIKVNGFIALGDSVASFNPVYGQGMSVAAEACLTLDRMLRYSKIPVDQENVCHDIQYRICTASVHPWFAASAIDLSLPEAKGGNPFFRKYIVPRVVKNLDRMLEVATKDKYMLKMYILTQHMMYGYKWFMFDPKVVLKMIFS